MTIFGWDASDFDWDRGPVDLVSARAAGIDFFTHKATENTNVKHVHFGEAMRRARDAGVPFLGAYHVVRSPANAAAEVDYCLAYVNAQTPWWKDHPGWFWQIDLELWKYDKVRASEGEQFADIIEARTGCKAIIYASKGQYGNQLAGTNHPLWNANYGANKAGDFKALYAARGADTGPGWASYSGVTPVIWQYASKAQIGRQSTCDANAFRGTVADFARLIGRNPAGGDDMAIIAKDAATGQLYLCFLGGFRSFPIRADKVADIKYLASQGAFTLAHGADGPEWEGGGWIRKGWFPEIFGPVDTGPAPAPQVQFDAAALAALAAQVAQAVGGGLAALRADVDAARAAAEANLSPVERTALDTAADH